MTFASERAQAESLLRACLRGECPPWPGAGGLSLPEAVLQQIAVHGVGPLVCDRLGAAPGWPQAVRDALRAQAVAAAMWEESHRDILVRLTGALAERGIEAIVLKGTALAYTCYADPALRARSDTDLLVPEHAGHEAGAVLGALGLRRVNQVSGEFISYQCGFEVRDRLGLVHAIDLHWRLSNAEVLARLFSHGELRGRARPVPRLGANALATAPVDALMIACMHRELHGHSPYWVDGVAHFLPDRLIWLYDVHLLAGRLTAQERAELGRLAIDKGLARVCHDGLARAAEWFGTEAPAGLLDSLVAARGRETAHTYLNAGLVRREYMNFRALAGLGPKLRLLREVAFPPASYMRARYAGAHPDWLPLHYLRRGVGGLAGRLWHAAWGRAGREPGQR